MKLNRSSSMFCRFILCFVLVFLVGGCVAALKVHEKPIFPDLRSDKGLVYFYRESEFIGGGLSYYIYDGDKKIGGLKSGTYFFYWAEPGEHTFWAKTEAKSARWLTVEAGKVYYFHGGIKPGFWVVRPDLKIVTETEGSSVVRGLKYATLEE